MTAPAAMGRVLPTLNEDGTRRWIRPKPAQGRWWQRRRIVAYLLMLVFFGIPYVRIGGKPLILLNVPARELTIFGTTFLPTDTLLLMLLLGSVIVAIFLFSALFGRVWCGWGCPQTIYMEYLFRPIERLIEKGWSASLRLDRDKGHLHAPRIVKNAIYFALALVLAHTFLAYFVGVEALAKWVRLSPWEHPVPFLVMAFTTVLIFLDFAWFREQTCLIACPYGRWQAALIDRQSMIVAYDARRGEPREHGVKERSATAGDCVDCGACVLTCPTGIDIRNGLQMECINCTQCMDACDEIMDHVGKPRGLIRYASQDSLAGKVRHLLRPRVVLYPLALTMLLGGFVWSLRHRELADVTLLRSQAEPFTVEDDGRVANQVRIRIGNRTNTWHLYQITVAGASGGMVVAPENPLGDDAGELKTTSLFVLLPQSAFVNGSHDIVVHITDGGDFNADFPFKLLGPTTSTGTHR
jgi:cytochrome c oxidase accessory protein FixG